jgi:predicted O-methyltransferase YrrM
MSGIRGLVRNLRAVAVSPTAWWLARQAVTKYGAIQHIDELTEFVSMLRARPLRTVLEIGTAQGGMFWLLCRISTPDAMLVSLDLPPKDRISGGKPIDIDLERMKQAGQTVHAVLGNSHDAQIAERVRTLIGKRDLDLLFIDGDHTYDGVRQDYEMYSPLLHPGGFIAFHDITHSHWPECQVDRFWADLATNKSLNPRAIFGCTPSHFGGIGVVRAR